MVQSRKKSKPDVAFKEFWRDNDRFASLFNAAVFGGRAVVSAENLEDADTDVSGTIEIAGCRESIVRSRDVVKKSAYGLEFVILGLESQQKVHYAMPLRTMLYDGLGYLKECRELSRYNKRKEKLTEAEFLSGLKKSDRLQPIISIVVYYGEEPWDGPVCLKDMLAEVPEEIAAAVSDYRMNMIQVRDSSKYCFDNEDVRTVFEISEYIFRRQFGKIEKKYGNIEIMAELAAMIGHITGSDYIMRAASDRGGMKMNMCSALKELEQQGIEQGIEQSIRNLMESNNWSMEFAMDALKIPIEKREYYAEKLEA